MTTSPSNIRLMHSEYQTEATAKPLANDEPGSPRVAPGYQPSDGQADTSTGREHLKVISGQLKRAPIGYSIFLLAIPVIALLVVLVVNIVLSNRQYDLVDLNSQLTTVTQSNEAMAQQLSQRAAPQSVVQQAADLGMVLPGTSASIDLSSGEVIGSATAAEEGDTPTSFVSEPTVGAGTGVPAEVEAPAGGESEPVTVTDERVAGPESNTTEIVGPEISVPAEDVTNSSRVDGVANDDGASSMGSLQGPQVSLPSSD